MARLGRPSKGFTFKVQTLLDKDTFDDMEACRKVRGETQAEFVRQSIIFFILTKCSFNPMNKTMQSDAQEPTP